MFFLCGSLWYYCDTLCNKKLGINTKLNRESIELHRDGNNYYL
jgi:hypothetical protein